MNNDAPDLPAGLVMAFAIAVAVYWMAVLS